MSVLFKRVGVQTMFISTHPFFIAHCAALISVYHFGGGTSQTKPRLARNPRFTRAMTTSSSSTRLATHSSRSISRRTSAASIWVSGSSARKEISAQSSSMRMAAMRGSTPRAQLSCVRKTCCGRQLEWCRTLANGTSVGMEKEKYFYDCIHFW